MNTQYTFKGIVYVAVPVADYLPSRKQADFAEVWGKAKAQGWKYFSARANASLGRASVATFSIAKQALADTAPNDFKRLTKNEKVTFVNAPFEKPEKQQAPAYGNAPLTKTEEPDYKKLYENMVAVNRMNLGKIAKRDDEIAELKAIFLG